MTQGPEVILLEAVIRSQAVSRAGVILLGAKCGKAAEVVLVCRQWRVRARAIRLSWHLAALGGSNQKDGPSVELDVCSFMTTAPNALTDSINHERMPVLLSAEDQFEKWLSGTPDEAFALARSFDPGLMRVVQSGKIKRTCSAGQS